MAVMPVTKRRKLSPPAVGGAEGGQEAFYRQAAGWNLEQDYENRPRKQKKREKESSRLPIKTADGRVERPEPEVLIPDYNKDDDWLDAEERGFENAEEPQVEESVPKIPLRQQILEAKEELARLAMHINENPEEHAGAFRALGQIATTKIPTIKRLALATQLAVYKDAIPGYRIRPIAEADQTEKVSREVRRLRAFEQSLVSSYQAYLVDLAQCAKGSKDVSEARLSITAVAISCACALLLAVPHFNFRGELLKIIVARLSARRTDANTVKCRDTLIEFFQNDEDGTPSLDAVSLLTKMMKTRGYQIDEGVLNTFLHLRLLSEFSSRASENRVDKAAEDDQSAGKKLKPKKEFRTKKLRKIMKERKAVEKDFQEADAIVSHEQRDRMQAETLKMVFVTYFRILKARIPSLTGAVLEGLAKYAHLINQDFFGDLLEALKDLINDAEALLNPQCEDGEEDEENVTEEDPSASKDATREALLCITTAFALLEGQDVARSASALNLDLTYFIKYLYRSMHALSMNPDLELSAKTLRLPDPEIEASSIPPKVNVQTTSVLLLKALASILIPRTIPPVRLAAFSKQIYTSSLHLPEKSTLAILGLAHSIAKTHGRKIGSLWNTDERKGDGVFDAYRGDLEGSNPFASTVWEGELLRLHFVPGVRDSAKNVEKALANVR